MIDHLSFPCTNLKLSSAFYDAALMALGYARVWSDETAVGYGHKGGSDKFALKLRGSVSSPGPGFHVAFTAPTRDAVDAFYRECLKHGGRDKGAPGPRPQYGPDYYAAFVLDPDGHHIEAVCHH